MSDEDWLRELPHHVVVIDVNLDALDWCLDNLAPREWHNSSSPHKKLPGVPAQWSSKDTFAFKHVKHAVMFKLMFWKPENIAG